MNGTPKRGLQITPTQPASTRKHTRAAPYPPAVSQRGGQPRNTARMPRPEGRRAETRGRPRQKPAVTPGPQGRRPRLQGRPRKLSMEQITRLAVSVITALAQLLNAIHRIRTGHGAS